MKQRSDDYRERARIHETLFRYVSGRREPLAPPGEAASHVHYQPLRRAGLGCITSRRQPGTMSERDFLELLAFEMGLSVVEVRRLLRDGDGG